MDEEQFKKINEEQKEIEEKLDKEEIKKEEIELMEIALFGLSLGFVIVVVASYFLNKY